MNKHLFLILVLFVLAGQTFFSARAGEKPGRTGSISMNRTDDARTIRVKPGRPAQTGPDYNMTEEIEIKPEIDIYWDKNK
ncbi:MAG: hypothetical protein ACLFSY_07180 [Desulfonatronovibrionaceae bacterium]